MGGLGDRRSAPSSAGNRQLPVRRKIKGPGTLRFRGQITVGVRRALLPMHTVGRLAFAGRVLPDATLRGMRIFRSHGGTVPTVANRDLLSEALSPGSDVPCRERRAGRGVDAPAIPLTDSHQHHAHGGGTGFWPAVNPALRVWPLTSQVALAFAAGGDTIFHAAPIEKLADFARSVRFPRSHLPCASCPFRPDLLAGLARRETQLRSGLRSSNLNPLGNCVGARFETSRAPDLA